MVEAKKSVRKTLQANWQLWLLVLPGFIWLIIFAYGPIYGLLIAFKDYQPSLGITGSPTAKPLFKHFRDFFSTAIAGKTIRNTLSLAFSSMIFSFPFPVLLAIVLNQMEKVKLKNTMQTIAYSPYFVSNVVVVSILSVILAPSGFVNTISKFFTGKTYLFMSRPQFFVPIYVISNIWQTMGFNSIIYLSSLASISPEYYEAATVDGANSFQKIWYIDLPLIVPTIIIMLILNIGGLMSLGYEKVFLMQSGSNLARSEIVSTYVYKVGLQSAQYSFATAIGLFNSVVNFILLVVVNAVAKKFSDISIF